MAQGLDELVEWLVGEVSFYGDGESNGPSMVLHASLHIIYLPRASREHSWLRLTRSSSRVSCVEHTDRSLFRDLSKPIARVAIMNDKMSADSLRRMPPL